MDRLVAYDFLRKHAWNSIWSKRIIAEIGYLLEVSKAEDYALDDVILPVVDNLFASYQKEGVITNAAAQSAEEILMPLQNKAKEYHVTCAAHAHIDMNWLWGFQETASLTVDTFKTILKLMEEYPTFTFSQSQASVYKIVEQYHPQMLEEIRKRVHEGRWEVTASTWVEHDKNLAGSEAMARQLLYTKRYLSKLLDIPEDSVELDFEPDTFGHTDQVPEILSHAGVKYYYHCRGMDGPFIYNWYAPSGARVLVYREPAWYNQTIEYDLLLNVPSFCKEYHTKQYLKVYGVGDHGGGPTRRDLDRLLEMAQWPLFPTISFGRIGDFFKKLEADREHFPTVNGEINYVFTGCYTSQARTKQANKIGEDRLVAAEALDMIARNYCADYKTASSFEPAWQKVLFNQFHDILPGSGIRETREYALGTFQEALSTANINANHAMSSICERIDTSFLEEDNYESISAGAGVGYGVEEGKSYGFPVTERGCGTSRVYTIFNTTQFERSDVAEIMVWDWPGESDRMYATDAAGNPIPLQILSENTFYWGHLGTRIAVPVHLPAMGYTSVILQSKKPDAVKWPVFPEPRVDRITDEPIVLENSSIQATFSPNTMELLSLTSKLTGQQLIDEPSGYFAFGLEDATNQMTAWRVGRFAKMYNLNRECPVHVTRIIKGSVYQQIDYTMPFENSTLTASVILSNDSPVLRYEVKVDWNEFGNPAKGVPQLNFQLPVVRQMSHARCVVPYGTIDRPMLKQDVPCLGLIAGATDEETVALMSDCKYGFRNEGDRLTVDLIRASFDPDPKPEVGAHSFNLGVYVGNGDTANLIAQSICFANRPCSCATTIHKGTLPLENSIANISGCILTSIKCAEDNSGVVIRVFNPWNQPSEARLQFNRELCFAEEIAIPEWKLENEISAEGNTIVTNIPHRSIMTIKVVFM